MRELELRAPRRRANFQGFAYLLPVYGVLLIHIEVSATQARGVARILVGCEVSRQVLVTRCSSGVDVYASFRVLRKNAFKLLSKGQAIDGVVRARKRAKMGRARVWVTVISSCVKTVMGDH